MAKEKSTKGVVTLYPGVTLRGGEVILLESPCYKRPRKRSVARGRFTPSVDNVVENVKIPSRIDRKDTL